MGKALGSRNTDQLHSPIALKATYRRVLIGVVHTTLRENCRGNTG
jgi:hypothetical protein